jgi:hypothetical protein
MTLKKQEYSAGTDCIIDDNSWPVAKKFMSIGATKIHNNKQVITLDYKVQNKNKSDIKVGGYDTRS